MIRSRVLGAGLVGAALLGLPAAAGAADLGFHPCARGIECGRALVPADHSGATPGQIRLAVQRVRASRPNPAEAVLFLAGGPGQSGTAFTRQLADVLRPLRAGRDLLTVDTRGTGRSSDLIVCPALQAPTRRTTVRGAVTACAGLVKGRHGTAEVVGDIEALRQAGGYRRLWLVGVSYGTYTAQRYAAAHPDRVAGLVLDSVVDPAAPDALPRRTAQAIPRVLAQTGARRDLAATQARLPLRERSTSITGAALLELIGSTGDNPLVRAILPGALRRAGEGDAAPLERLMRESRVFAAPARRPERKDIVESARQLSEGAWLATLCRDTPAPWSAQTPLGQPRLAAARAGLRALDPATTGGFDGAALLSFSATEHCAWWPAGTDPAPAAPLPRVPTLILNGRDDLLTPTEEAVAVARRTPGAQLLTIGHHGHSVLSSDLRCVGAALRAFAAGGTVRPCRTAIPALRPAPPPPRSARELGRTPVQRARAAAEATADDAVRSFLFVFAAALTGGDVGSRFPGLRGGHVSLETGFVLRRLEYVPGVAVSGTLLASANTKPRRGVRLRVRGPGVRAGTYRIANPLSDPRRILRLIGFDPDDVISGRPPVAVRRAVRLARRAVG